MGLKGLDLKMLVALDALLAERNVTRAAERLGLSQPTLSISLNRLRRHFDDQLLYREGSVYHLTLLGADLAKRTTNALDEFERVFSTRRGADPAESTREFVVECSDYTSIVLGATLSQAGAATAPLARVHLRHSPPEGFRARDKLRSVDGLVMPHGYLRDLPFIDLFQDRWVCVVSEDNQTVGEKLTMEDLARLPWVTSFGGPGIGTLGMRNLAQLGVSITVETTVDNLLAVPHLVAGTGRIAMVQEKLANGVALPSLRILECPFDAGVLRQAFWWHPDHERDPEHIWFRDLLDRIEVPRNTPRPP